MLHLLWLIPAAPFAGFVVLALAGRRLSPRGVASVGIGSIAVSAVVSLLIGAAFLSAPPAGYAWTQALWTWIDVGRFRPQIAFYLDPLSLVMTVVVTFVSLLIHVYSAEFMAGDEGYGRFFAYMNLFVASMVVLLLADNLLLLYAGWEGVGLCSYLLIGFWYRDPVNGRAARKAFIVTRVGDTAMAVGLFLLFHELGTLQIQPLMQQAAAQWGAGSPYAVAAALLLLGGAVGKSAQLPLQTWLPDAMAGPTPTSALIHAATMVTAGVYLIARTHVLFALAPVAQHTVAVIGLVTLLMAGFSALTQHDIKRVLAYSTISQIGYMFLALGVGAWAAAIFHFMTHAFFKALLFLAAGIVIEALHDEHDMFRMGGLRRELPVAFWAFVIGGSSLAGLPLVTAGFYSKDLIVWSAWSAPGGSPLLWIGAVIGVLLTAMYTFRLIFLVFFGEAHSHVERRPGLRMTVPVLTLIALSVVGGFVDTPPGLGHVTLFTRFVQHALPAVPRAASGAGGLTETSSMLIAAAAFALGLWLAFELFLRRRRSAEALTATTAGRAIHALWASDWGMDWLYDRLFVRPVVWFARVNRRDVVDLPFLGAALLTRGAWAALSRSQTGRVRWYAAAVMTGTILLVAVVLFL
ncbi:MAG TPA: NADH-quinone oxidoreductase subunit L [Vicinamibacterales bacterium]|nr:NADH-quinone oxidoreductase subunit L [Vicinamibacterales bacterium]